MEYTLATYLLRLPAIILGIIIGYLALSVYRITKGGSSGWYYLTSAGAFLFLWSASTMLFSLVDVPVARYISGIIFLLGMGVAFPLCLTKLLEDFGARKPKWLNVPVVLIILAGIYIVILLANIISGNFSEPLITLLSISHIMLGIGHIIAILPAFLLSRATKQRPWKLMLVFAVILGVGINLGQYYVNCCSEDEEFSQKELCVGYDLDYSKIYNLPCIGWVVSLGKYYQISLFLGIIILPIAIYQLNCRLRFL